MGGFTKARSAAAALALMPAILAAGFALTPGAAQAAPSSSASTPGKGAAPKAHASAAEEQGITFDDLFVGADVTDQYASEGVVFTNDVFTTYDSSNPTAPVLAGKPRFYGDIVASFTQPGTTNPATADGFTLDVGFIDDRNSVEIEYYDAGGAVVGAVRAQSYGINRIDVTYRGVAGFKVSAVSLERAGFAIDNLVVKRGAAGAKPSRMASLGDSYTSGEGLLPNRGLDYDCGTDLQNRRYHEDTTVPFGWPWLPGNCQPSTGSQREPRGYRKRKAVTYENRCHRHGRAYPNQIRAGLGIASAAGLFAACSGATTDHIGAAGVELVRFPHSPFGVHGGQTQLQNLRDFASQGAPGLITVGIGGNDAQFGEILKECVIPTRGCDEPDFGARAVSTINGTMFRKVRDTFVALRAAYPPPATTIVAFGYPSVIDEPTSCWQARTVSEGEWRWVKETALPAINDAIKDAATEAGVLYVDITNVTAGRGVCSDEPWINGLRGGDDTWFGVGNESFHPNQDAHDAIARHFLDHYTDGAGTLLATPPDPSAPIRPATGPEIRLGRIDVSAGRQCGADCLQPAACVQACSLQLQGAGFTPGATLQATLHSTPVDLGQLTADETGRITASLPIPATVGTGDHTLELEGMAADGTRQRAVEIVRVFRRTPARVLAKARGSKRGSQIKSLTVRRLPRAARVRVACARGVSGVTARLLAPAPRGRAAKRTRRQARKAGCPFAQRTFRAPRGGKAKGVKRKARAKRRKSAKRKPRAQAGATRPLALGRSFSKRLDAGTVVRLVVTEPGAAGRALDIRIRKGKRKPKLVRSCVDPGRLDTKRCR